MKKTLSIVASLLLLGASICGAQDIKYVYTEGSDLNLIGKIIDTPNPYHRVDTVKYKGFTSGENNQVRCSAGLAIVFRTNSPSIAVKGEYGYINKGINTMGISLTGYDLYIKDKSGKWVYAASGANERGKEGQELVLISDMDSSMKECLLYLPLYSELRSFQIGVKEGSTLESLESPFRHRIGIFGSSYTHGISTSRPGMSYPMQFTRATGIQMLSLGCSGNSKLQSYFADVLVDCDVDAFVFDAFSNPSAELIEERLFPFIEKVQAAHPGIPLIFQQTIRREKRNFNTQTEDFESRKMAMSEKLMKEACKKYKDVYFIYPNAADGSHEYSVDGIHPDDHGYALWEKSIEKPILKILRKYGIR